MKIKMMRPGGTIPAGNGRAPGTGAKGGSDIHWLTVGISVGLSVLAAYVLNYGRSKQLELMANEALAKGAKKLE